MIGRYRRLTKNFILANYNTFTGMQTDDGSSRYIVASNYIVFGMVVINSAMVHGNWLYQVGNVHAYPKQIGTGWAGGGAHTYVYNGTIVMRETPAPWCNEQLTLVANNSIFFRDGMARFNCNGAGNAFAPTLADAEVTQRAEAVLAPYPKPAYA